jgi:hypothetical protein
VSTAEMGSRGSRSGDLQRRRVVLVAESAGLAAVLNQLLDPADRLSRLGSLRELAESRSLDTADVVVLDVAAEERTAAVGQIRRRYLGPLIILVTKGEPISGLRLDDACGLLFRPFSTDELGETLGAPGRSLGTATATAAADRTPPSSNGPGAAGVAAVPAVAAARRSPGPGKPGVELPPPDPDGAPVAPRPVDPKASARQAPVRAAPPAPPGPPGLVERGQRLLIALTQGWQARRRVRVAGFSVFALIAFTAAFALAAQGGRCGPGCDAFGTVFSPGPTVAPASSRAPSTTGPKRSTTTTAAARSGTPGAGAFQGISGGGVASTTTTTAGRVTTTTDKKPATTRPATTRPATTQSTAPPTTAPPTTAPPTTAPPTTVGA